MCPECAYTLIIKKRKVARRPKKHFYIIWFHRVSFSDIVTLCHSVFDHFFFNSLPTKSIKPIF
jgi:hypothetical protein